MNITVSQTAQLLRENDNILILLHAHPDGDTVGSGYALYRALSGIGKKVSVLCEDNIPASCSFVLQGIEAVSVEPEFIVAVDVAVPKLLGARVCEQYAGSVDLCIDHHISNSLYAENTLLDDNAAACAEIVFRLLREMRIDITPQIADCLYTGVSTDTGCFRYSNVTSDSFRIAAELIDLGADFTHINKELFETKSKAFAELERLALNSTELHFGGLCAVIAVTSEMFAKSGTNAEEFDRISALPRQIEGVLVGCAMREQSDGSFKVSVRTNPPMNAAEICKTMNGGGHVGAAGCTIAMPLDTAKAILLEHVGQALKKENKVSEDI